MTERKLTGYGVLRSVLEAASADVGCSLTDLTVLSTQVDPYRLDTPSGHRDGQWVAEQLGRLVDRTIHWRGLHYVLVSTSSLIKPNGELYRNDEENWGWLVNVAGKASRWLGYIPFERITDNRNAEPFIHHKARVRPESFVSIGLHVDIPSVEELQPRPFANGFDPRQAFHFVIFGEKAGLEDAVLPIAEKKQADLYLPSREISDTLLYQIAQDGADDRNAFAHAHPRETSRRECARFRARTVCGWESLPADGGLLPRRLRSRRSPNANLHRAEASSVS
jgi:hypothetical protein